MDWIKQNKFLAVWLAVTVVGAGVLGFLFMSAKGQYSETQDAYTAKVSELQNMQNSQPFPDEENYKKMLELQKAHQAAIDELQSDLAKVQVKDEPMTAVRFQDELRATVTKITTDAGAAKLKLPDKFYAGFDPYQAEPPKDEAAAPLGRMLKAIAIVMKELTAAGAVEMTDIKRDFLPEEGREKAATAPPVPGAKPDKDKDKDKGTELVRKHPFEISFVANESSFRTFLNALVKSSEQFFIPKFVIVENEKVAGPSKVVADAGGAAPTPPDPTGGGKAGAGAGADLKYVVGDEKLKVAMRIEVVEFAKPAEKAGK